jgi:putative inorganic carbon (HCO3(-)) transporter
MPNRTVQLTTVDGAFADGESTAELLGSQSPSSNNVLAYWWRRILLGIVVVELPLQIDKYFLHDMDLALTGALSGFIVSISTFCLILLYAQWLPKLVIESRPLRGNFALTIYTAIVTASTIWALQPSLALYETFLLGQSFLLFIYIVNTVTERNDVIFIVTCLTLCLAGEGMMMLLTQGLHRTLSLGPIYFDYNEITNRVSGSLGAANVAASFFNLLLPLCCCLLFSTNSKRLRQLSAIALLLGGLGLVLTLSRGGWIGTTFSIGICVAIALQKKWLSHTLFIKLSLGCGLLIIACLPLLAERIFGDDNGSAQSRISLMQISTLIIADHPFGVGANNWAVAGQHYADRTNFREEWFYTVHNKYLLVLTEVGIIGFLAFGAFILTTIRSGWRILGRSDRLLTPIALGLTAGICGQQIHMMGEIFNSRSQVQLLLLAAALIFAIENITAPKSSSMEIESP